MSMTAAPALKAAAASPMAASTTPRLHIHHFLCLPSKPLCNKAPVLALPTCFSLPTGVLSLRKVAPLAPLVVRTSDWAQQVEENEAKEVPEEQSSDWEEESGDLAAEGEEVGEGKVGDVEAEGGESEEVKGDGEGEEEYPQPPEEAKLFVGNVPFDMDSDSLAELFDQAGVVDVAEVIYNRATDQSRGFGFVTMRTVEEAEKAIEMLNFYEMNGNVLNVSKAAPRGTRAEKHRRELRPHRIYVGNLPWSVDSLQLQQIFSEHGKVISATVVCDKDSGRSRGFGFVAMSSQTEQEGAIAALDGKNVEGRSLRVDIAEDRSQLR